jgi:hypothetical protein
MTADPSRLSVMERSAAAQLTQTGNNQNKPPLRGDEETLFNLHPVHSQDGLPA